MFNLDMINIFIENKLQYTIYLNNVNLYNIKFANYLNNSFTLFHL